MAICYEIYILPSGNRRTYPWGDIYWYRLEKGLITEAHTVPVWCRNCQDVTMGEVIETLEDLDTLIAALTYDHNYPNAYRDLHLCPQLKAIYIIYDGLREVNSATEMMNLHEKATLRRRWRYLRVSPPKCLRCGKTDIQGIPLDEETEVEGNRIRISLELYSGWGTGGYLTSEGEWMKSDREEPVKEEEHPAKKWWQFWS